MKQKSKFTLLLLCIVSVCYLCVVSCHDDVATENEVKSEKSECRSFLSSLDGNLNLCMDASVVVGSSDNNEDALSRSSEALDVTPIYVDISYVEQPVYLNDITTSRQLMNLVKTTGAEISLTNDGEYDHTLLISNEDCKEALAPLIQDSKSYLYGKGFSEDEIQSMLSENDVDESALVPFVIYLTEEEEYQLNNLQPVSRAQVDWNRAGRCAIHALGFDALACFSQSNAKTWSKRVLKRVFKTVAAKMVGPVGVMFVVLDFSLCYWG